MSPPSHAQENMILLIYSLARELISLFLRSISRNVLLFVVVFSLVLPFRFRNVSFEITSVDVGVFEVTGRFLGKQIEKVELVFQVCRSLTRSCRHTDMIIFTCIIESRMPVKCKLCHKSEWAELQCFY